MAEDDSKDKAPSGKPEGDDRPSVHVHLAPETSSKSFDELTRRVEALEKAAKKPFYTDKSFWIGIITIPLIFAGDGP
ncbi:hypothetical protein FS827_24280 [Agrobacterium vitis]|uniref:hypothetical protein n=1 Tax=Allorhizobium ampelinum TaxID=3025782 RepID=UPI001F2D342D|nr:hypothetical protein [Allorhizobium ampelinum]MCF1464415.1 hypothetical protein [Allorhizobium ampelinum]